MALDRMSGAGTATAQRETQVTSQLARLYKAREAMQVAVSELEQRLTMVLRPTYPSPSEATNHKLPEQLVPHAESLKQLASDLEGLIAQVRDMTDRAEV